VEREASLFEEGEAAGGPEDRGPYVVVRRGLDDAGVVVVAASLEGSDEAVAAVAPLLSVGGAVLLGLVAAVTWVATGAGLRPVEAMRGEAARISTAGLERRLPVPAADDELRRLAVTLNEMLDRLEASAVRRRRFVADASHELRSPLAALRTIVEVGVAPAADAALTADLLGEIGRLQRLVDDLLFLAAADERVPIRRARVELDRLVEEQAGVLVARRQAVLDTSLLRPVAVAGDPDLIARLVRNLTENAARHAASSVWVETTEEDGWAVLRVDDDGAGIPPEDRERVFERFVRLDEGRSRDEGGTGLGLAIARAAARRHGGDVRVVEPRHGGAGLEARLPLGVGD
jgi:signal transduction histidine kinase